MVTFKRYDIDVKYLESLAWQGDVVVDYLNGGVKYFRGGIIEESKIPIMYPYPFDSVEVAGNFAVLYEKYGTKGLLVTQALRQIREINRSYYFAKDYAYPITAFQLPDGRDAIIHCPKDYCSLEVELVDGSEPLSKRKYKSQDYFHSKLQVSSDSRYLVENAWVWHPVNVVQCYDIQQAIKDPSHLDGDGINIPRGGSLHWEPENVTICNHRVITASIHNSSKKLEEEIKFEILPAEEGVPESEVSPEKKKINNRRDTTKKPTEIHYLLQVYDLDRARILSSRLMPEMVGRMMPAGRDHIVSFYDHPKLLEITTGKVVLRWEDLYAGPEIHQPNANLEPPQLPAVACDPARHRFAIGSMNRITIIEFAGLND